MISQEFKLENVAKQIRGVSYKKDVVREEPFSGYIPLLRANNIQDDFKLNTENLIYIPKSIVKQHQILKKGDIIIAASSGSKNLVGKATGFDLPQEFTFGAFCKVLRPISSVIRVKFLWYYFQSYKYRWLISNLAAGAGILNIRNSHLNEITFTAPKDLKEQDNIIATLDKSKGLIDKRKKNIDQLDELLRSTFLEMFGEPVFNSKKWNVNTLGSTLKTIIDYRGKTPPKSDSGILLISAANVKNGKLNFKVKNYISEENYKTWTKRGFTEPNDLLFTTEAPVGEVALYPKEGVFQISRRVIALRVKENLIVPEFLLYQLLDKNWQGRLSNYFRGSTVPRILKPDILNQEIIIPDIKAQIKFKDIYNSIQVLRMKFSDGLQDSKDLFQSILQRAFHGDLLVDTDLQLDTFLETKDYETIERDEVLIQKLIDRFNIHNNIKNVQDKEEDDFSFESFEVYENAKEALFHLLKVGKAEQTYDETLNQTTLKVT